MLIFIDIREMKYIGGGGCICTCCDKDGGRKRSTEFTSEEHIINYTECNKICHKYCCEDTNITNLEVVGYFFNRGGRGDIGFQSRGIIPFSIEEPIPC